MIGWLVAKWTMSLWGIFLRNYFTLVYSYSKCKFKRTTFSYNLTYCESNKEPKQRKIILNFDTIEREVLLWQDERGEDIRLVSASHCNLPFVFIQSRKMCMIMICKLKSNFTSYVTGYRESIGPLAVEIQVTFHVF